MAGRRGPTFSLILLIGAAVTGLTVGAAFMIVVLVTTSYEARLVEEFRNKINATGAEITADIGSRLRLVRQRLSELAQDNGIRVPLMLDVDFQLTERLADYHDNPKGAVFYIRKESGHEVFGSDTRSGAMSPERVPQTLFGLKDSGEMVELADGGLVFVHSVAVSRRADQLGLAVSAYDVRTLLKEALQGPEVSGSRVLLSDAEGFIDLTSNEVFTSFDEGARWAGLENNLSVRLGEEEGVLVGLASFPGMYYFASTENLRQASSEGAFLVVVIPLAVTALGLMVSGIIAGWIVRPLRHLTRFARDMAEGGVSNAQPFKATRISEIDVFANSLLGVVSTQKRAERRIQRSFESLETILNNMDAVVYISDIQTHELLFINNAAKEVTGEIKTEGQLCWQVMHSGQTGPCPFCTNEQLVTADNQPAGIVVWEHSDERRGRWFECRDQAVSWIDGRLVRMEVATDITGRKAAEKELTLSATVFHRAYEAVMVADGNWRIEKVNRAFSEITGFQEHEVIGSRPDFLLADHSQGVLNGEMQAALEQSGAWEGEIRSRRKNGEVFHEWLSVTLLRDTEGRPARYVSLFSDISKRKEQERKISQQANFDFLTGLPNRFLFNDRLDMALSIAKRDGRRLGLLFIDLDRFKYVNDTLGHEVGDDLLREAARRLRSEVRESDTVARLGGDEFTVIVRDFRRIEPVELMAEAILGSLSQPYLLGEHEVHASASIGITVYPNDGSERDVLLRNADNAMYRAKERGRNDYQFYTSEMNTEAQRRRVLENALYKALENGELFIQYQPIVWLDTGELRGVEALLRWRHPELGLISPAEFIPLAEDTGLIRGIGAWVLKEACTQAAIWRRDLNPDFKVSVNLSSRQMKRSDMAKLVAEILERAGLPADALVLEITESLLMSDDPDISVDLLAIQSMGVALAVDDFGTGYSSLSYLKHLPVEILKIDRSFVRDLPEDSEDAALVQAILSIADSLGLRVVAEGVETEQQAEFLREHGCELAQGYLFSRPVDAADLHIPANKSISRSLIA